MASVLLVNTNLMQPAIAPIGLDYLATALKNKGYDVDLKEVCFLLSSKIPTTVFLQDFRLGTQ